MPQARNAALRREKELMARHYAQLKAALDRGRAAAADRLKQLSVMSGAAMQVCNAAQLRAKVDAPIIERNLLAPIYTPRAIKAVHQYALSVL